MTPSSVLYNYVSPTIAALTLLLNSTVVYVLVRQYRRNKRGGQRKHSAPLIFLANLAISDLLVGLTVTVIKFIFYLDHYRLIQWSFSLRWANHLMKYAFLRLSLLISVFNLASLTIDRFLAIRFPMTYRIKVTNKLAFFVVAMTWLLSVAFAAAHYGVTYFSGIALLQYDLVIFPAVVFPAAVIFTICYSIILLEIRKQGRKMRTIMADCCKTGMAFRATVDGNSRRASYEKNTERYGAERNNSHEQDIPTSDVSGNSGGSTRGSKRRSIRGISISVSRTSSRNGGKLMINNNTSSYGEIIEGRSLKGKICDSRLSADDSKLSSRINSFNSQPITGKSRQSWPLYMQRREMKVYKFVGTVVCVFMLCWLPIAVCGVVLLLEPVKVFTMNFVFTLAFANSVIDPIVYFFFNDKVVGKLRRLMCKFWCTRETQRLRKDSNLFSLSSGDNNSMLSKTRSISSLASADTVL